MSFARDVVDAADRSRLALVAIAGDGERSEISAGPEMWRATSPTAPRGSPARSRSAAWAAATW